ncbi:hypothetical protein ACFPL7_22310 [Dongia soli]|uniref:Uncharacterized protein n=1 Tax=Dongia soli TaxID=600628 RepID=A0ABU5E7M2_9PROT|nr:hypothetical protein [Dongia soli]MDY0882325.1 hypothetical protein [Dongia soli]
MAFLVGETAGAAGAAMFKKLLPWIAVGLVIAALGGLYAWERGNRWLAETAAADAVTRQKAAEADRDAWRANAEAIEQINADNADLQRKLDALRDSMDVLARGVAEKAAERQRTAASIKGEIRSVHAPNNAIGPYSAHAWQRLRDTAEGTAADRGDQNSGGDGQAGSKSAQLPAGTTDPAK